MTPDDYQTFEDKQGSSPSEQKIPLLQLPSLEGKTVLDIGCNEGFFSFECEKHGAVVTGIDSSKHWIGRALVRKFLLKSNVTFIHTDWMSFFDTNHRLQFDLILFTAAFHYVKGGHQDLLQKIHERLNRGGLLILEVGIHQGISSEIKTVKRSGDGGTFQYPTWPKLYKMLVAAGFDTVHTIGEGIHMKGDPVPRFVIHCKKN